MATETEGVRLSLDLDDPEGIPYFLWDEPMTLSELRTRLQSAGRAERLRLLGRILREARDADVWRFTTPAEVLFLTGGGALAGYHLGHRETHDLDLFTLSPAMEDGVRALRSAASETAASWQDVRTAPEFRRVVLSRGNESVIVDLVVEHAEQLRPEKPRHGVVAVDPAEEIFANKLCALLGRSEARDLVDVRALEGMGLSLSEALAAAQRKDGGLTPAQLAWVLSQITIGDDAKLPGGVRPAELRDYLRGLIDRLARLAHP